MFLQILRANPGIQCFILNTGVVGGMVRGQKITIKDSVKIVEMIAKDKIKWARDDFWGYEVPSEIPGVELDRFDLKNYYSDDQIDELTKELKRERVNWLSQSPSLNPDILGALNR
jgi:phosphoenolpyruvate carboxykinase (ATP)